MRGVRSTEGFVDGGNPAGRHAAALGWWKEPSCCELLDLFTAGIATTHFCKVVHDEGAKPVLQTECEQGKEAGHIIGSSRGCEKPCLCTLGVKNLQASLATNTREVLPRRGVDECIQGYLSHGNRSPWHATG